MKAQGAAIMGGLALVSLGVAYATWQRPKESKSDTQVTVLDASKTSLQKIHYDDGTRFLEVTRTVEGEPAVWVKQGFIEGKAPVVDAGVAADAGTGADGGALMAVTPPAPATPPAPTRVVRGSDRADKLWEKFAPFEAVRALGVLPAEKLKELNLDATARVLDVTVAGATRRFRVGAPLTGIIGLYVLDEKDQHVYLLPNALTSDLEPSSGVLVDRRLHAFKQTEFDSFAVSLDGKQREFVVSGGPIPETTKVAPKETPDKPDEFAKNWHDKVWNRLIVTEVLGKDETPAVGQPKTVLRVDYKLKGKDKGWFELAQVGKDTFGRSEQTAGWVGLHAGVDEMVSEAKKVVGDK